MLILKSTYWQNSKIFMFSDWLMFSSVSFTSKIQWYFVFRKKIAKRKTHDKILTRHRNIVFWITFNQELSPDFSYLRNQSSDFVLLCIEFHYFWWKLWKPHMPKWSLANYFLALIFPVELIQSSKQGALMEILTDYLLIIEVEIVKLQWHRSHQVNLGNTNIERDTGFGFHLNLYYSIFYHISSDTSFFCCNEYNLILNLLPLEVQCCIMSLPHYKNAIGILLKLFIEYRVVTMLLSSWVRTKSASIKILIKQCIIAHALRNEW